MRKICSVLMILLSVLVIVSCSFNEELEENQPVEETDKIVIMLDFSPSTKGITGFEEGNAFLQMRGGVSEDPNQLFTSPGFWMSAASMQCLPLIPALKENKVSKIDKTEELIMFGYKVVLDTVEKNDDGIFFRYYLVDDELTDPSDPSAPQKIGQIDYYYEFKTSEHPHGRFSYREIITPFFNYIGAGDNIFVFELTDVELTNNGENISFVQTDNFKLWNYHFVPESIQNNEYKKAMIYQYNVLMNLSNSGTYASVYNKSSSNPECTAKDNSVAFFNFINPPTQGFDNNTYDLNKAFELLDGQLDVTSFTTTSFATHTVFKDAEITVDSSIYMCDTQGVEGEEKGVYSIFAYKLNGTPKGAMIYRSQSGDKIDDGDLNPQQEDIATNGCLQEFKDFGGYEKTSLNEF